MRVSALLGPSDVEEVVVYASSRESDVAVHSDIGVATTLFDLSRVGNWREGVVLLEHQSGKRKALEITGITIPTIQSFLYSLQQTVLITKTESPPGAPMGGIDVSGAWPDPWWTWLLEGAKAALPHILAGNLPIAALRGIGGAFASFLEEKTTQVHKKRAEEKIRETGMQEETVE
ncbi:unnamed protein product [Heligmosomoides polygyrus]|uniref:ATG_C domain-containing protein n=1 Tax=Heligmosomoides polygyrus TaxID=6339 RepID=A0A183GTI1_HELPZ|nr:unnamed protein product [Heligmosomoides polygyrus]